jgi:hypothetical protein
VQGIRLWWPDSVPANAIDLPARLSRRDQIDQNRPRLPKTKKLGSTPMRNDGALPTRQKRREHVPLPADPAVTYCVCTTKEGMEPARFRTTVDFSVAQAEVEELAA